MFSAFAHESNAESPRWSDQLGLGKPSASRAPFANRWAMLSSTVAPDNSQLSLGSCESEGTVNEFDNFFPAANTTPHGEAIGGCGDDESAFLVSIREKSWSLATEAEKNEA